MKGQSAIEYLMTYGWMLLVVAIVGGAIFSTVNGRCIEDTSGFTGSDISVEDIGLRNDNNVVIQLRNTASDPVIIEGYDIQFEQINADTGAVLSGPGTEEIPVGGTETFEIDYFGSTEPSEGCNEFSIEIEYNITDGISNQIESGEASIQAQIP